MCTGYNLNRASYSHATYFYKLMHVVWATFGLTQVPDTLASSSEVLERIREMVGGRNNLTFCGELSHSISFCYIFQLKDLKRKGSEHATSEISNFEHRVLTYKSPLLLPELYRSACMGCYMLC